MKRKLFSMFVVCMALGATAQTTMDTAGELKEGMNSFEYTEGSSVTAYWKYTTTAPTLLTLNPEGSSNIFVKSIIKDENDEEQTITLKSAEYGYPKTAYGLPANTTVYVGVSGSSWSGNTISVGVTAEMLTDIYGIGKGLTAEDALEIKPGTTQIVGSPFTQGYDQQTYYATFSPTMGGVLVLMAGAYVSSCTVNGVSTPFNYDSSSQRYVLKTKVKRGETYSIEIKNNSPVVFSSELTFPQPGSVDMPFDLVEGDNILPSAYGKYYYQFVSSETGFARISSDNPLPEGQVKMYESATSLQYDSPSASSAVGSLNLRFEMTKTGNTYYVVINKSQDTALDEKFQFSTTPYQTGDLEYDPIVIETLPANDIVISEVGTYYYAVDLPAGLHSFLVVEAAETPNSAYTGVNVYKYGAAYQGSYGQNKVRVEADGGSEGARYILKWVSKEDHPLLFSVYTEPINEGDLASNPITAVIGDNVIDKDGVRFYAYTATKNGKLVVTAPETSKVAFLCGSDRQCTPIVDGQTYTIDVVSDNVYVIKLENVIAGDVFRLAEEEYQPGDARSCPLDIQGEYDFSGKKINNVWIRFTADKDGMMTVKCNIPYSSTEKIQYCRDTETAYPIAMVKTEYVNGETVVNYEAVAEVEKGESWLVNMQLTQVYDEAKLVFIVNDPQPGESVTCPIVLEDGMTYDIPKGTYDRPVWAKISVEEGSFSLKTDDYIGGYIYDDIDNAKNDVDGRYLSFSSWEDGNYLGYYIYKQTVAANEAGDYILKLTGNYSTVKMTVAIDSITTAVDSATNGGNADAIAVYTLSGTKVDAVFKTAAELRSLGKGIYIVKQGGKAHKVILK